VDSRISSNSRKLTELAKEARELANARKPRPTRGTDGNGGGGAADQAPRRIFLARRRASAPVAETDARNANPQVAEASRQIDQAVPELAASGAKRAAHLSTATGSTTAATAINNANVR